MCRLMGHAFAWKAERASFHLKIKSSGLKKHGLCVNAHILRTPVLLLIFSIVSPGFTEVGFGKTRESFGPAGIDG